MYFLMYVKEPKQRFSTFVPEKMNKLFKQFNNMKKISVIALVAVGLLAASCNSKEKTDTAVATEQAVAESKGEMLTVDTATSV
jgi:hypothetical protein